MSRWLLVVSVCLSLASLGCGGNGEEPTEIPKTPPKGKSLPRFAEREAPQIVLA